MLDPVTFQKYFEVLGKKLSTIIILKDFSSSQFGFQQTFEFHKLGKTLSF
jgi:hypothetical protein